MDKIFEFLIRVAPFTEKYIKDIKLRTKLFLRLGLAVNVGYALFNVFTGVLIVRFGLARLLFTILCYVL